MENILKKNINLKFVNRRKGDVPKLICNCSKAKKLLLWRPKNSRLRKIIQDEVKWIYKLKRLGLKRRFKYYI